MQYVKYFLKQSIITLVYLFGTLVIALGISLINGALWLKIMLSVVNIVLFLGITAMFYFVMGKKAAKKLKQNNEEREEILRTGVLQKLDTAAEYSPYKGFIIGFIPYVLMIIFVILDAFGVGHNVMNVLLTLFYGTFYMPLRIIGAANFYVLYGIILTVINAGIFYMLGAKFQFNIYRRVDAVDEEIYGKRK